jgi:hypothetical protein
VASAVQHLCKCICMQLLAPWLVGSATAVAVLARPGGPRGWLAHVDVFDEWL